MLPVDIHTHHLPAQPGAAIVNCFPETFAPQEGGWYSVGMHPWHVTRMPDEEQLSVWKELAGHPQVLAVGEAGLDKLAEAPLALQQEVFIRQARLAEETGKPLVIHAVKAADELLLAKRTLHPSVPWLIHGFRGKAALATVYLKHGFHLSFGEKYQEEALRTVPADRLFIETDESAVPVEQLYARAAEVRGVSLAGLTETVRQNVLRLFFKG